MHNLTSLRLSLDMPDTTINAGFSLIEVLISILVLSFGIFGAMKMQLHSIQMSQQSNFYSTAIELASDMAERMRRNHGQLHPANSSSNTNPSLNIHFQSGESTPESTGLCHHINCSPDQLANADIVECLQRIDTALPNARAVICRDSSPWNSSTGKLNWDCSDDDHASVVIKLGWSEQNNVEENTEANPAPRFALAVAPFLN